MKIIGCLLLVVGLTCGCSGMTEPEYGIPTAPPASSTTATEPTSTALPICGKAVFHDVGQFSISSGGSALSCFVAAVRQCRPASIRAEEWGVDAGSDIRATIEPGTTCRARYVSSSFSMGTELPASTTDCDLSVTTVSLHFACPGFRDDWPVGASS
jgi:hypothetical protein